MNSPCALYNCDETFLPLNGTIKRLTRKKAVTLKKGKYQCPNSWNIRPYSLIMWCFCFQTWTSLNDNPLLVVITLLMKRHSLQMLFRTVLFVDGHQSHFTLDLILFCIPLPTTHTLYPLVANMCFSLSKINFMVSIHDFAAVV